MRLCSSAFWSIFWNVFRSLLLSPPSFFAGDVCTFLFLSVNTLYECICTCAKTLLRTCSVNCLGYVRRKR